MYGSSIGSLNVYLNVSNRLTLWWRKSGSKGNVWKRGIVGIGKKTQPFQVLFQGIRGLPEKGLNTCNYNPSNLFAYARLA